MKRITTLLIIGSELKKYHFIALCPQTAGVGGRRDFDETPPKIISRYTKLCERVWFHEILISVNLPYFQESYDSNYFVCKGKLYYRKFRNQKFCIGYMIFHFYWIFPVLLKLMLPLTRFFLWINFSNCHELKQDLFLLDQNGRGGGGGRVSRWRHISDISLSHMRT